MELGDYAAGLTQAPYAMAIKTHNVCNVYPFNEILCPAKTPCLTTTGGLLLLD